MGNKDLGRIPNPLGLIYKNAYPKDIYNMKFVYNFKLMGYTTLMSHMNELYAISFGI